MAVGVLAELECCVLAVQTAPPWTPRSPSPRPVPVVWSDIADVLVRSGPYLRVVFGVDTDTVTYLDVELLVHRI